MSPSAAAIVREPRVLACSDEPLSNLDAKAARFDEKKRAGRKLHQRFRTTFIYVTPRSGRGYDNGYPHRRNEGRRYPAGRYPAKPVRLPLQHLRWPALSARRRPDFDQGYARKKEGRGRVSFEFGTLSIKVPKGKTEKEGFKDYIGKEVIGALRPELLHDEPLYLSKFTDSTIEAYVEFTELMGAEIYLYLKAGEDKEGDEINLISRVSSRSTAKAGDTIKIAIDTSRMHFFDKDTEQIIVH